MGIRGSILKAGAKAGKAAAAARRKAKLEEKANQKSLGGKAVTRGKPKDTPEQAEKDRKLAAAKAKERKRQENLRNSESKSSINKGRNVSKADKAAADEAADIRTMQARIDEMPSGIRKKMMQGILDRQEAGFIGKLEKEFNSMVRKQTQAARDRKPFKGYDPSKDLGFSKGGMATKRKAYSKGGYVNCGASNPGTQGKKR